MKPISGSIGALLALALLSCAVADPPVAQVQGTGTEDAPQGQALSGAAIVSYNVENLFDTIDDPATRDEDFLPAGKLHWTGQRYRHKLDQLARAITWAGDGAPMIVGLAEVENEAVMRDLAATAPLKHAAYTVVHFDSPDERGIDVGLLVRSADAQVVEKEAIPVDLGRDHTRDVLYALVQLKGGERLHVLMNHWPSRREGEERSAGKRMAAARVVRQKVDAILRMAPRAKVLVMGDFNDYPQDASIRQGLQAACATGPGITLVDLMCAAPEVGGGSIQYQGEWGYFDQMIASNALLEGPGLTLGPATACRDGRLLFRHPRFGPSPDKTYGGDRYKGGFSDHLPVVAHLKY